MPVEKERYPKNWSAIAREVKQQANWRCQHCDRPCRRPHESLPDFIARVLGETNIDAAVIVAHPPPENLRALCAGCHLNYDRPFRGMNGYAKRERSGQLNFLEGQS